MIRSRRGRDEPVECLEYLDLCSVCERLLWPFGSERSEQNFSLSLGLWSLLAEPPEDRKVGGSRILTVHEPYESLHRYVERLGFDA